MFHLYWLLCLFTSSFILIYVVAKPYFTILHRFSAMFFGDNCLAYYSTLFFIMQPANIFMSSIYTESLFSLLFLRGLILFYSRNRRRFFAACLFSLATLTRSNGLLSVGFFGYDMLKSLAAPRSIIFTKKVC